MTLQEMLKQNAEQGKVDYVMRYHPSHDGTGVIFYPKDGGTTIDLIIEGDNVRLRWPIPDGTPAAE